MTLEQTLPFPSDPLEQVLTTEAYRRSVINGILDSYNSNYDLLAEAVQNAVDALEDAKLLDMPEPFLLDITVNLRDNWVSVLDTGTGLNAEEIVNAFKPHVSLKLDGDILGRRGRAHSYRGYKGVGLTFLVHATDDVRFHSKKDGQLVKARMQYGHAWAIGSRAEAARLEIDTEESPLEEHSRGTFIKVRFSGETRPKSLAHLGATAEAWRTIVRTRTAAGQLPPGRDPVAPLRVKLHVTTTGGEVQHFDIPPTFLYPHSIERDPVFRFLDLAAYFAQHAEHADPPPELRRQDGLYMSWDHERILQELTGAEQERYAGEVEAYTPNLYAFVPYQGSVWAEMNELSAGNRARTHLYPGLMIAVNRQRLADIFEIEPTRFETFSRNVFVVVHFDGVKPDQGRKTVQDEVLDLAKAAANRAVQYLGRQRGLLKEAGEAPTPQQRETELNHQDWILNVRTHAQQNPLHVPPVVYASTPLAEQDVVGLFNQLAVLGVFPGVQVLATSQSHTYDCLIKFDCPADSMNLRYSEGDASILGLSPFVIGDSGSYETALLTLEFKNNLDGLIADIENPDSRKSFNHIDVCACWASASDNFAGYELVEFNAQNLDDRSIPGATHILRRDGEGHAIQVIMLRDVIALLEAGRLQTDDRA